MKQSKADSEIIAAGSGAGTLWLLAIAIPVQEGTALAWATGLLLGTLALAGTISVGLMIRDRVRGERPSEVTVDIRASGDAIAQLKRACRSLQRRKP